MVFILWSVGLIYLLFCVVVVTPFDFLYNDHFNPGEKVWSFPPSQWEPFCKEKIFFKSYVRIYRGRNGPLLKERGPGFLMVRGMENIYVCTNGVIFLYYEEKSHQGHKILSQASSDRTPHSCQLYNFNGTAGSDHYRRSLVAILLTGHPVDYRMPSMQIFVAPIYRPSGSYYNQTSISMISQHGECWLEKGKEKTLVRVRVNLPTKHDLLQNATDEALMTDNKLEEDYIAACNLDSRTQTGMSDSSEKDMTKVPQPALEFPDDTSRIRVINKILYWDDEMVFKGCLPYPLLNSEQVKIIAERVVESPDLENHPLRLKHHPIWEEDGIRDPFWTKEHRSLLFSDTLLDLGDFPRLENFIKDPKSNLKKLEDDLAKETDSAKKEETQKEITELNKKLMVAPYHFNFGSLLRLGMSIEASMSDAWFYAENYASEGDLKYPYHVKTTMSQYKAVVANYTSSRDDRRLDPYNINLVQLMEENWEKGKLLGVKYRKQSSLLGRLIADGETLFSKHQKIKKLCIQAYYDLQEVITRVEKGEKIPDVEEIIPRLKFDIQIGIKDNDKDNLHPCYVLPRLVDSCKLYKPHPDRACQLLRNRKGKLPKFEGADEWRKEVFDNIEKIFTKVCPYLQTDFAQAINNLIKGYLLGEPRGTGEMAHIDSNSNYFAGIYISEIENSTYEEMAPHLRPMDPFWTVILEALRKCLGMIEPLEFWRDETFETGGKEEIFAQRFPNKTVKFIPVRQLYMSEQADIQFAFNWALDMGWRVFATVLGSCIPAYQDKISLMTSRFYGLFTRDFLYPLRQIWMNRRDNPVFEKILGSYYGTGLGDKWTRNCMEASFAQSGERHMRPPRHLYVNAFTEMNFFTSGPMAGTLGSYGNTFI